MKFKKDYFNLVYKDKNGKLVKARRRSDIRGHQLEDGTLISHTKLTEDYDYVRMIPEKEYYKGKNK